MNIKIDEIICKSMESLRGYFSYEDCNKILIYVLFLKYIVDNKKIPLSDETFTIFLDAQRMLDKSELDKDTVINLNYIVENTFNMPNGSLSDFSNLYFRMSELKKVQSIDLFTHLNEISFENQSEEIIQSLKNSLWNSATSFGRIVGSCLSNKALSKLSKELLELNDNDIFADLAYGLGVSSLEITENVDCSIVGYELNKETSTMAQMLIVISGREKYNLYNKDSTTAPIEDSIFDKIAIHPPLSMKVRELEIEQKNLLEKFSLPIKSASIEVLMTLKAISTLKSNGKLVLTVSPNILFSATAVEKKFRELIAKKHLNTVIVAPSLYYGTNVQTVLLILEKEKSTDKVQFLDINNNEFFSLFNTTSKVASELTDDMIQKIVEIIKAQQELPAVSSVVKLDAIERNDFLLSPAKYVQVIKEKETISNIEIDKKLKELYTEIKILID